MDSTHTPNYTNLLNRVFAAVEAMTDLEGQDPTLVIEMSQAMLNDILTSGELKPVSDYVAHYCDVIESPEDAERIAAGI